MDSYQVIRYQSEHREAVQDLLTHIWGDGRRLNEETFRWKYHRNPYLQPPIIYVALHKNVPVAMRGFVGTKWSAGASGSEAVVAPCAVDTIIHPDHRNRGLFHRLTEQAALDLSAMGYPFMLNLSASPVVYLASLATGWKSVGPVDRMIYARSSFRYAVEKRIKPLLKRVPALLDLATDVRARLSSPETPLLAEDSPHVVDLDPNRRVCLEAQPRPSAMARLAGRVPSERALRHVKDEDFFEWRFHNPRSHYRFVFLEHDEDLQGYVVLQHSRISSQRRIDIVDWEALDDRVFRDLLSFVVGTFGSRGLLLGGCVLSDEIRRVLGSLRFVQEQHTQSLRAPRQSILVNLLKNVDEPTMTGWHGQNLLDIRAWDMRQIISDAV